MQTQQARLSEGMRLIFDQESPGTSRSRSRSSSSSSSSGDSSYSSSQSSCSSYGSRRSKHRRTRHRSRSSSSSSSDSSSDRRSRRRSRSHPRCHRSSGRSRCRHGNCYAPRRYRASSRSCSSSSDRSYRRGRMRHRASSYSSRRSSSRENRYRRRSRSRSSSYRRVRGRFVGRYRCRFSPSPKKSYRDYRGRSRSPERFTVQLSQKEKADLLNIAKENAAKILGVTNLVLPASVQSLEQQQQKEKLGSNTDEELKAHPVLLEIRTQGKHVETEDDKSVSRMSPTRKPITFSFNNTVAKPSSSPTFYVTESKVTSRADSVGNRKPYGQWVPVKKLSQKKH